MNLSLYVGCCGSVAVLVGCCYWVALCRFLWVLVPVWLVASVAAHLPEWRGGEWLATGRGLKAAGVRDAMDRRSANA